MQDLTQEIRQDAARIRAKPALRRLYQESYRKYCACLDACPGPGAVLELGSGAGFAREFIPDLVRSDVFLHRDVDLLADAVRLPFADASLRAIVMLNVFHHIPDVAKFLHEAVRCLRPGGRLLVLDQHVGLFSYFVLKYLHDEGFDPAARDWAFPPGNPLHQANGALAWLVFRRDRARFEAEFPDLELLRYTPHTPLRYWLAGGLKTWSLLPDWGFAWATALDRALAQLIPNSGSFVEVEVRRKA